MSGENSAALQDFVPNLDGAFFSNFNVRKAAEKAAEKLTACRKIERLQCFDENVEKICSSGRARLNRRAGAGRVRYGRLPLPVPAGLGKVEFDAAQTSIGSNRGTKVE